jgi:hypothetical protein
MVMEDMSRNKCFFQVLISHDLQFISICDHLLTLPRTNNEPEYGHSERPKNNDTNLTLHILGSGDLIGATRLFIVQLNIFVVTKWYEVVHVPLLCVLELRSFALFSLQNNDHLTR